MSLSSFHGSIWVVESISDCIINILGLYNTKNGEIVEIFLIIKSLIYYIFYNYLTFI